MWIRFCRKGINYLNCKTMNRSRVAKEFHFGLAGILQIVSCSFVERGIRERDSSVIGQARLFSLRLFLNSWSEFYQYVLQSVLLPFLFIFSTNLLICSSLTICSFFFFIKMTSSTLGAVKNIIGCRSSMHFFRIFHSTELAPDYRRLPTTANRSLYLVHTAHTESATVLINLM